MTRRAVVLDIDGTLVDSNYHHIVAWSRAFGSVDLDVPGWRIHAALGMGGDKLVDEVAGARAEKEHGDAVRELWEATYDELVDDVRPFEGATDLVRALQTSGAFAVLATSGLGKHTDKALAALGLDRDTIPVVSKDDADRTKPDPDLVQAALREVRADCGVMVGDTVWDAHAAAAAGIGCVGLLTGGISEAALVEAGCLWVAESPRALLARLDELVTG